MMVLLIRISSSKDHNMAMHSNNSQSWCPIPEFAKVGHQIVTERQVLQRRKLRNAGQRANVVLRKQQPLAVPLVDGGHRVNVADTASVAEARTGHMQRGEAEKTKRR